MEKKSEQVNQTPEEKRQQVLNQLDATKQAIAELSEDELDAVSGGSGFWKFAQGLESLAGQALFKF